MRTTPETRPARGSAQRADRRTRTVAVLAAVVPPLAWLAALAVTYMVEDFVCSAARTAGAPVPDAGVRVALLVIAAVLLLLTVVAGVAGLRLARRVGRAEGQGLWWFLGYVGAGLALVFAFGIVLIGANPLVLEVCA